MRCGTLFIVSTPIGNLGDMTLRAIEVLKSVDVVAAEDTRHSKKLLSHFGISASLLSLHEHNERQRANVLLDRLQSGESIALISDAGTPLISDPGFRFVQLVRAAGVAVVPIVGACAAIAGLVASGLSAQRFEFIGFLPAKGEQRQKALLQALACEHTTILYESTHRLRDLLTRIADEASSRQVCLAKELTKQFEAIVTRPARGLLAWLDEDAKRIQGEFVVIVEGRPQEASPMLSLSVESLLKELLAIVPLKQAVASAVTLTGKARNELYRLALEMQEKP